MLVVKDLYKKYKPKKGAVVTAIDRISLKFPEKGMVFILGKSGSGKSTLLNLLGGLDKYDDGEIIIKGESSKKFSQKHFDSYRNTYVGFIFQEYNLLTDFSVGANIALAIELQGRKATEDEVNNILEEVELQGFGNRKINELSGGQKQRVAIARALVKNPEIIMADEPTGALDSETGRQVFDTLKKLSRDKLVIIVSHDREFSELYADRIIELADGKVISDVEVEERDKDVFADIIKYKEENIEIPAGYQLTKKDIQAINEYMAKNPQRLHNVCLTDEKIMVNKFVTTNEENIEYSEASRFKLIKSKLPMGCAFKLGTSALGHKKIKLAITILLCCISFGLFGLAAVCSTYSFKTSATDSIIDNKDKTLVFKRAKRYNTEMGIRYDNYGYNSNETGIAELEGIVGQKVYGIFKTCTMDLSIGNYDTDNACAPINLMEAYSGYLEINETILRDLDAKLVAGRIPDGSKNEIAISKLCYKMYEYSGYVGNDDSSKPIEINSYEDMLGKVVTIWNNEYTIVGIVDTNHNIDKYERLFNAKEQDMYSIYSSLSDILFIQEMISLFETHAGAIMVGDGVIDKIKATETMLYSLEDVDVRLLYSGEDKEDSFNWNIYNVGTFSENKHLNILWLNGEKGSLAEKEIVVDIRLLMYYDNSMSNDEVRELLEQDAPRLKDSFCRLSGVCYNYDSDISFAYGDCKIVGVVLEDDESYYIGDYILVSDEIFNSEFKEKSGNYTSLVCKTPESKKELKGIVDKCYTEENLYRYEIGNGVVEQIGFFDELFVELATIFLWIGTFFACFAAIMLANYIGTSITYKSQDIGILRALGARSSDVFKIFFSEAFVIAMINFVLSSGFIFTLITMFNSWLRNDCGVVITVLHFGITHVAILLLISVAVAVLACYLPIRRVAIKKPIDAIKKR